MRHRSNRIDRQYAAIPNAALRDERLSIEARGLLALLMTYSDNWTFRREHLMRVAGVGRDKFQRLMREIIEAGYVERVPVRAQGGKVSGSEWLICDDPDREPENPVVGGTESLKNRPPVEPAAGKSGPLRKPRPKKTNGKVATDPPTEGFSENWRPSSELIAWAQAQGFTAKEIEEQTRLWIDHWLGLDKRPPAPIGKSWRGWMQIELDYRAKRANGNQRSCGSAILRRVQSEYGRRGNGQV